MADSSSASDDQNTEEIVVPKVSQPPRQEQRVLFGESHSVPPRQEQRVLFGESHSVQITTFRLNGSNYFRWSQSVQLYIRGRGKLGYLTGEKPMPDIADPQYAVWDAENSIVMTWLVNSMEEDISSNYMCYSTAKELWDSVTEMYSDLENKSQIYELTLKVREIRQGDNNVTKYFHSLKRVWHDLDLFNTYKWNSAEDAKHHRQTVEEGRIFQFLAGLNEELDEVRGRIIGRATLPSLGEVFAEVRREETRRSVMMGKTKTDAPPSETNALAVETAALKTSTNQKNFSNRWCDHCNRPGHTRESCWKIIGRPAHLKGGKSGPKNQKSFPTAHEAEKTSLKKEQVEELIRLLNSNFLSGTPSGSVAQTGNFSTPSSLNCTSNIHAPWIIDSGASDHMTSLSPLFKTYSPCSGNGKIRIADGSFSAIAGKGKITLSNNIDLGKVLHVPKLSCNLLSISKICKDSNCSVTFFDTHCVFQDRISGKMIGSAKMKDGLYYFEDTFRNKAAQGLCGMSCTSVRDQIMLWHNRLGHPNFQYLRHLFPDLFKNVNCSSLECESCVLAKNQRAPYYSQPYHASRPFYLIHSDVWGPSKITTQFGKRWFVTFIDDHTRLCWVYLMHEKSEVPNIFKSFSQMVETQFDTKISILRSDNGTEYFNQNLNEFLKNKGIQHQSTCPNTPQQNGTAERKNKHLLEVARAIMFESNVPKYLWGDAVLTAAYLINRMPTRVLNYRTPLENFKTIFPACRLHTDMPLKVFGCTVFMHKPSTSRSKLDPRAEKCIFVGYSPNQKGYRVFNPITKKLCVSMDVTFLEHQPFFQKNSLQGENNNVSEDNFLHEPLPIPIVDTENTNFIDECNKEEHVETSSEISKENLMPDLGGAQTEKEIPQSKKEFHVYTRKYPKRTKDQSIISAPSQPEIPEEGQVRIPQEIRGNTDIFTSTIELPIAIRKGTRTCTQKSEKSSTNHPISQYVSYQNLSPNHKAFTSKITDLFVPRNIEEALDDPNWNLAVLEELSALKKNETWEITDLPRDKKQVGCKWVFTIKCKADGSVERYKARLVAKGFTQTYGVDYQETFAPVAKLNSVRILISLAASYNWPLHQLDVKNAFLNGELEEEVFMSLPPGFEEELGRNKVCRLKKSLYGLKQSPRAWFERFGTVVKGLGYIQSQADHTLFYKHSADNKVAILIVYVDDIILTGDDSLELKNLREKLAKVFEIKELGPLKYFLGIEFARSKEGIFMNQRKYILDLLKETGLLGCKAVETPMEPNLKLQPAETENMVDKGRYQRLVGRLIYLSHTRPDIAFAVSMVSQFMHAPGHEHLEAVFRILRYLKGSPGKGLLYKNRGHLQVEAYTDADWAGSVTDRRSTSGYCTFVGGNLVSWRSKKQTVVARSSAEAEFRAVAHGICEALWVEKLLQELKFKFNSYSAEDDDYEGYDYSLQGQLSAVRIVFLYRFVQEIMVYFMELASPHTEEAIKLVDKVGGFEWLIQKYEIDGATSLKLDLALETPIIVVPRNSMSKDFIQLDLGKLQIKNEFSWYGSREEDPSAVHIDLLHAQILGINMSVGIDGFLGKPMIREGQGLDIFVRRSLRDVFRKVPTFSLEVKVDLLHGIISDKEYKVILDCTYMNLSEEPRLPASFRGGKSGSRDTIRLLVDKVNLNSQNLLSQTVTIVTVVVNHALLELCNGTDGESPLAHIALEGLWVSYRMTSLSETDLFVTIPKFSILDVRPDTKPEMRLMLGSSTDASKQAVTGKVPFSFNPGSFRRTTSEAGIDDMPISTMFLMDYRWRMSSQSFVIRLQQPRVLVVPDFLLAVTEFFVPALGALTGREETMDPKNDPINRNVSIVLMESVYKQKDDVMHLSPSRQLVADCVGIDEYTYDGCGKVICLSVETDAKEVRGTRFRPIIVIGRGKRLRFVNVKIENGSLLRKYTYLNNDSSYSITIEDGVEIVAPCNLTSGDEKSLDNLNQTSGTTIYSQYESNGTQSFTLETQVVSSEFTFYDGSKSFLDDSSYGEKLVRAKLDMSFMYASKEKDTWIRALLKDFTVEAGSGLVILDPVDISGGYTSVKDKTSISLISTDICIHLSLSAASLILNLQSQASAALNFGNANPLVQCTNFDRIWVSEKESGSNNNITFWRPQAPANYVILGDCVTSRPIPPSQAVMAVSNTYGRVRKPVDFHLIGSFLNIQGHGGNEGQSITDNDCSLWMPIAPPGYTALGCVAHVGSQPPPNHVVHCLRSDLVTSAKYSDCLFNITSNNQFTSGFSIWRLDNAVGSFFAHSSIGFPLKNKCYDLNHLLVWSSNRGPLISPISDFNSDRENNNQQTSANVNTSGWEILKSISKATNFYMSTPNFERIWWDKGSDLRRPVSIWRPIARRGYAVLGDCITEGLEPPALGIIFKNDNPDISSKPVQFTKVSHIVGKGVEEVFFWFPIAPPGYVSLGCVVSRTDEAPHADLFCCPRMDLVSQGNIHEVPLSRSSSSRAPQSWSIWKVENQACTFLARSDLKKPSSRLAYIIGDSVKPKTRENINAELKLRYFSLTMLDSLCGMMRPLFDTTITNIKLATHGGLDGMNAVLISSIVASTFNAQLEAWEPLVEPFDGIFKFETFDTNEQSPLGLGKRIRISATSILNVNISAANLESSVGSILSWRRQLELEQKASKLNAEGCGQQITGENTTFSALDEDDLQTVIVENRLGCDVFVKKVEHDIDTVDKLHHGDCASVWIPPPRFSNRLNVAHESREARYYVAVQILEAKGLPIIDDGNSHNFFCALRLVVDSQASEQQKLFPQSARTKCVKPVISRINSLDEGRVKWNELFIFEVPRKAPSKLEIEVTNLAAKAGKGDVVGALSFSVGHGANILKKVASVRMFHQPYDNQSIRSYPLSRMTQQSNVEAMHDGCLIISTSYFERNTIANLQKDMESDNVGDRDIGLWVGLGPECEWESIRSLLPLSVVPISLQNEYIGMEVVMKNGKKHVIFRGLVTVVNDSDVMLNILTCHTSHGHDPSLGANGSNTAVEEVFQNQYYHPSSGWGSNGSAMHHDNPGHWSTRDFSHSSKDFFEPPLPPGWKWASGWSIDKFQYVDKEGWAYGPDIKNFRWPPTSSKFSTKSASDVVRRRRWIRTRQTVSEQGMECLHSGASTVQPGASAVLSWRSTFKGSDQCLQVQPNFHNSQLKYSWGQVVAVGSSYIYSKDQLLDQSSRQTSVTPNRFLKLNELEKKDILLRCNPSSGSKQFWFSVGTDAAVLNTELNIPVYDWRISINSPMKLENRLPCPAEFSISEKTKGGNCVERHHGVMSSRQSVHIYSADIQKPLYLTLFVQGGWIMEKDPILILDPSFSNHVSSFWMVHRQSKRKLRVSIEHDVGGTSAAPKTCRLFVPYWIVNDSSLALAYRLVEVEPSENAEVDSVPLSRAVKSAKTALKSPISSMDRRRSSSRKNLQVLEVIEDNSPFPSMLSPQDYAGRSGVTMFQSQKDTFFSPRLGISVSMRQSEVYSSGISLHELENKERIDVKAFNSDGSYYKLSAVLNMTSDRTKVVHFQPHTMFVNRVGCSLCLQQCDTQSSVWIQPTDPPKPFGWQSSAKVELLKLRIDGYKWSTPFSVSYEGVMRLMLKKDSGDEPMLLRVAVRSGAKRSRFEVIFRPDSLSSPYRIENRSMFLPVRFRQVDGIGDSWQLLLPNSAASFLWEDLGRRRILELFVDGTDPVKSLKYDIDEISDHQPIHVADGPTRALRVTIVKEERANVVKISDWMPETEPTGVLSRRQSSPIVHSQKQQLMSITDCEFHINFDLAELGISITDHTPEEILYLSVQNLVLAYSTGLGSGISRFKLRMSGLQVDNQLPLTPMPVLFRPQRVSETDYILKCSVTMQSNGSLDLCVYPYIGLHGPENSTAFLINIHEPIIWHLHEMIQKVKLSRLYDSQTTAASVDPIIQIGVLNISEVRFKVSMAMSPSQRPRGVLGFWASLMTALGNTENMPVRINQRFNENICMRQSSMISMAISNIRRDLLGQPLQLLSGVDILGNASSALGHMSKGVAALSMDKKFIQSRQRQESKGVEDFGDVIREGGGAFAKGLFRGVTGILTKPLEGAKTSGVEGFVQGVGKGIIGAAAQPVSGVLDLLSKTTEGANAMRMKIASAITSEEQLLRRRLPRVISGDNLLQLYDEYKAQGQVILQLAESGSFFGQVDLFKVRGKFALSDAYEDHFMLPKGKILMVTHRRVILLQQPSNIIAQRKFSPARDPCSILWDILWDDFGTMELTHGKKENPKAPPSRLILYSQSRSLDVKENTRIIKCSPETHQALKVYSAIDHAVNTYGPGASKGILKNKVTKPYSPLVDGRNDDLTLNEDVCSWSSQLMPGSAPLPSSFGSSADH